MRFFNRPSVWKPVVKKQIFLLHKSIIFWRCMLATKIANAWVMAAASNFHSSWLIRVWWYLPALSPYSPINKTNDYCSCIKSITNSSRCSCTPCCSDSQKSQQIKWWSVKSATCSTHGITHVLVKTGRLMLNCTGFNQGVVLIEVRSPFTGLIRLNTWEVSQLDTHASFLPLLNKWCMQ